MGWWLDMGQTVPAEVSSRNDRELRPEERIVLVTSANDAYYPFLASALGSLASARRRFGFDVVVLDLGLSDDKVLAIQTKWGAEVRRPEWCLDVPEELRVPVNHAWASKTVLPQLVPGYDIYFWFDADGWAQGDRFFGAYIEAARQGKVAVVQEDDDVYAFDWRIFKWDFGNLAWMVGPWRGWRCYRLRVNAGFVAARADSRLWSCWRKRLEEGARRTRKLSVDQHALKAAIVLDGVDMVDLGGAFNWICSRARPMFDVERGLFCLPYEPFEPIAILHLAGNSKQVEYDVRCVGGGTARKALLFHENGREHPCR